ncbi:CapA family protein [Kosmotoga arenicorallina]|nr:CapA family protein [Kosmotoga arenicorallina]
METLAFLSDLNFQTIANIDTKLLDFFSDKLVIANFEGYLANRNDPTTLGITKENFLHMVKALNVKYLNIANNHIFDDGYDGFERTINFLNDCQIPYFGLKETPFVVIKLENVKVGILSFAWRMTGARNNAINVCWLKCSKVFKQIDELKKISDYIVVYPHWGIDMEILPHPWQITIAHRLLKHGVDLVVGHHPHITQPFEDKIFYSIGNTYLPNNEVTNYQNNKASSGLIVLVNFNGNNAKISFKGTKFSNGQLCFDEKTNIGPLQYDGNYIKYFKKCRAKKTIPIFTGKIQDYFFALPYLLALEKIISIKPVINYLRRRKKREL